MVAVAVVVAVVVAVAVINSRRGGEAMTIEEALDWYENDDSVAGCECLSCEARDALLKSHRNLTAELSRLSEAHLVANHTNDRLQTELDNARGHHEADKREWRAELDKRIDPGQRELLMKAMERATGCTREQITCEPMGCAISIATEVANLYEQVKSLHAERDSLLAANIRGSEYCNDLTRQLAKKDAELAELHTAIMDMQAMLADEHNRLNPDIPCPDFARIAKSRRQAKEGNGLTVSAILYRADQGELGA